MEIAPLIWQFSLLFFLIFLSAIFSSTEIAFITINKIKLEKKAAQGNRKAKRLLKLADKPAKFLPTLQVGNTLAGFLASAFAADNLSGRLTAALAETGVKLPLELIGTASLVLITMILSFANIVLGEIVPKRIALQRTEKLAFAVSGFIMLITFIFAPIVWLIGKTTNFILRLFRIDPNAEEKTITEEEIRLLVDAGSKRGSIARGEQEIIHNVFEFNDKTAEEVMTHRRDAVLLHLKDDDEQWEQTIIQNRHSYYPVCADTIDDIRGVLSARDYLVLKDRRRQEALAKAVKPAQFVPGTVGTHVLFRKMKTRRNHFAVVVDEYGCMDGIVTMSDLLECLVGDIAEEEDKAEGALIVKKESGLWQVSGMANLDKLEKETGISFSKESDQYGTFAGFVFTLLGRVPNDGENCELSYASESGEVHITITEVKEQRLVSALVRIEPHAKLS